MGGVDRRRFLAWLGGTAVGVAIAPTLDLEQLLWVPGERTIFLPTVHVNTLITPEWIVRDMILNWQNSLRFVGRFDRSFEHWAEGQCQPNLRRSNI